MKRLVINVETGDAEEVPLTAEEIAEAQARTDADIKARAPREIEQQRDATIDAGATYAGNVYPCDQLMVSAVIGRLLRWQLGRIPADQKLPVRTQDNKIVLLGQAEHAELGDAIDAVIGGAYADSWAAKDALNS